MVPPPSPEPGAARAADALPLAAVRVVHVTTVPMSLSTHLAGQVSYVRGLGGEVHVIASPGPELEEFGSREHVSVHGVPMIRAITPSRDLVALWRLWRTLRRLRPEIVHSHTPKGGLLGMLAATLAGTPVRVYHIRGLPFVTSTGPRRALLRATEWISCHLAHRVLAVSGSMRGLAIAEGFCPPEKIAVPAWGSGNGVDAAGRFRPQPALVRAQARARCGLPRDALVVGFLGRLSRDKGIVELAEAWRLVRERHPDARLILVGWNEMAGVGPEVERALRGDPSVHFTGPVKDTVPLYAAMDLVALPTYREGFPNVALEAAAMGLPIIATRVPGCVDAVEDGVTGLLVEARDARGLADALERYLSDPALRARHGEAARRRALSRFSPGVIWEAVVHEYRSLLAGREGARPCAG
ncbi:glycosyl transferase [Anaeromyxobacter paludicola]|uniref:Glycosyl transferase n=1 Tax=Anaeromyxobacter paludicola TaxID=2918171 RepID=A0ABM7X9K8_9BACT|nr:glycosyl transferase [Anaeromyxobacter paludicola]